MKSVPSETRPHGAADPDNFTLPALMQRLLGRDDDLAVRLYRVSFGIDGATNWHSHDDAQLLYGLSGTCIVGNRAGIETLLGPGDLVIVEPGEEHWHGAAPGRKGEHLAINLGKETTWLEPS